MRRAIDALSRRLPSGVHGMARDSAWTLGHEVSMLVALTASFILLGRELGTAGYGEYVGLFAITTPLSAIGSASMLASMQYMFGDKKPVEAVLSIFLTITVVGGTAGVLLATALAVATLPSLSLLAIITMAVAEVIIVPMGRVVGAGIRGIHGVPASVRVQLAFLVSRLAVLFALAVVGDLTVERLAVGWFLSSLAIIVWMLVILLGRKNGVRPRLVMVRRRDFQVTGALGAPIFVSDFQTNGDKIVLNSAGLESQAGLYGAAFRVVSMAMTPLRAMDVAIFHRFLSSDDDAVGQHTRRAWQYSVVSLVVMMPIVVGLLILAPQLTLVMGDEFEESVEMTRWLVLWLPIRAVSGAPLNGMLGLGRLGLRFLVLLFGAVTAMAIYIAIIPGTGWEGAVIGTVVAEVALLVAGWVALVSAQRRHDARVRARAVLAQL